jgi:hypothetical protein
MRALARNGLRLIALVLLAGLSGCGKSAPLPAATGGGGAGMSGPGCLDAPGGLPMPPTDRLPCDRVPPGLRL